MWLPKLLYESLPFCYLGLGAAGLGSAFYIEAELWGEMAAGVGLAFMVLGLMLLLRRKAYRASRSRTDFDETGH